MQQRRAPPALYLRLCGARRLGAGGLLCRLFDPDDLVLAQGPLQILQARERCAKSRLSSCQQQSSGTGLLSARQAAGILRANQAEHKVPPSLPAPLLPPPPPAYLHQLLLQAQQLRVAQLHAVHLALHALHHALAHARVQHLLRRQEESRGGA